MIVPIITVPIFYLLIGVITPLYGSNTIFLIELVVFAPLAEEIVKSVLIVELSKKYRFDGPLDGLIYGLTVGAGFATVENAIYGIGILTNIGFFNAIQIAVLRGGLAFIGHPIYSAIFGYGIGAYQVGLQKSLWSSLPYSILLHGSWNLLIAFPTYFSTFTTIWIIFFIIIVFVSVIMIIQRLQIALSIEDKLYENGYFENKRDYRVL